MESEALNSFLAGRRKLHYDRPMGEFLRAKGADVSLLLVEDDDVDAMSVMRSLRTLGLTNSLFRARDGLHALEMLRSNEIPHPRIILLDINMPRMNGLEFLHIIRADTQFSDSIVFVLSTSDLASDIKAAYRDHVAGYIVKKSVPDYFSEVARLLTNYWQTVEFPVRAKGQE